MAFELVVENRFGRGRISDRATSTSAGVRVLLLTRTSGHSAGIGTPSIWVTRITRFVVFTGRAVCLLGVLAVVGVFGVVDVICVAGPLRNVAESHGVFFSSALFRGISVPVFRFFADGSRTVDGAGES